MNTQKQVWAPLQYQSLRSLLFFFTNSKLEHIDDLRLAKYFIRNYLYMEHHKNYEASYNSLSSIVLSLNKPKIGDTNII